MTARAPRRCLLRDVAAQLLATVVLLALVAPVVRVVTGEWRWAAVLPAAVALTLVGIVTDRLGLDAGRDPVRPSEVDAALSEGQVPVDVDQERWARTLAARRAQAAILAPVGTAILLVCAVVAAVLTSGAGWGLGGWASAVAFLLAVPLVRRLSHHRVAAVDRLAAQLQVQ